MSDFAESSEALAAAIEVVEAWRLNGDTGFGMGMGRLIRLLLAQCDTESAVPLYGAVVRTITLDALVPELTAEALRTEGAQLS